MDVQADEEQQGMEEDRRELAVLHRKGTGGSGRVRGRGGAHLPRYSADGKKYLSKDGETVWDMDVSRSRPGRVRRHNIVTRLPGPKGQSRNVSTPLEAFLLFFPNDEILQIVAYTNKWIEAHRKNFAQERDARQTDVVEMRALIGLLYFAGLCKSSHQNVTDLWNDDGTGIDLFKCVMGLKRCRFLLRALRFDDADDRRERLKFDKLAKIRTLFDYFVQHCKDSFSPSEYVTVDEMLDPFRGKCPFRQYMPNKPAKYGIKIFAMCCARTYYTANLEIYVGKQPPGPYDVSSKVFDLVDRIITPVKGTGRNVTLDNYLTSVPLGNHMRDNCRLTIVGTVRSNKPDLPLVFRDTKEIGLPVKGSLFAFRPEMTAVCYKPKRDKVVLLLSTFHNDDSIDPDSGDANKPDILTFYNLTKGGVDVVDQMKNSYTVSRISRRWPLTLFFSMLNIGGINACVIYKAVKQENMERRDFLKTLVWQLCRDSVVSRATIRQVPRDTKEIIRQVLRARGEEIPEMEIGQRVEALGNERGRCGFCDRVKNRKTKTQCQKCQVFICREHTRPVCVRCSDTPQVDEEGASSE